MTECMKAVMLFLGKNGVRITASSIKIVPFNSEEIMSSVEALETAQMITILRRKYVDEPTVNMIVTGITKKGYAYLEQI